MMIPQILIQQKTILQFSRKTEDILPCDDEAAINSFGKTWTNRPS